MKKVRYLVGAAALSPVAIVALPGAAHAATTAPHASTHGSKKTVRPIAQGAQTLALATTPSTSAGNSTGASTGAASSAAKANTACASHTFNIPANGNLKGHGWYTIVTNGSDSNKSIQACAVDISVKFHAGTKADPSCKYIWASDHYSGLFFNTSYLRPPHVRVCGYDGQTQHHQIRLGNWVGLSPFATDRVNIFSTHNTGGVGYGIS
ncbi:MAG TPA: hypothetical protein VK823_03085 [Streptosporangiaceae bacterium]|nr:hypothetical protein [Streptosporangiaceae bacterium]HTA00143.1 hypothetical protein [Streptosporangiaceae bacterium]